MRKLAAFLTVALVALSASACQVSPTPDAAVVNGTAVSQAQLAGVLASVAADPGYLCSISEAYSLSLVTNGAGENTYDAHFAALVLTPLIEEQLAQAAVAAAGLVVEPEATEIAAYQLTATTGTSVQGCKQSPTATLDALPASYHEALVNLYADLDTLAAARIGVSLTPAGILAYGARHRAQTTLDCLDFVQASSLAAARKARSEILSGVSIAKVASSYSVASDHSIGCQLPSGFPTAVATAVARLAVGGVTQPVAFQSDYLVLELIGTKSEPQSALFKQVAALAYEGYFTHLLSTLDAGADVTIDPSYGTWSSPASSSTASPLLDTSAITPPAAPPAQFVPNSPADVGSPAAPAGSQTSSGVPTTPKG